VDNVEGLVMNVSTTTGDMGIHDEAAEDQVMDSVAKAVRDAAQSATQHAVAVKDAVTETGLIRSVSRSAIAVLTR
jgi:hypothetical protein